MQIFLVDDLCEAYLQEAKWYYEGHIPALEEYLNNAWISVAATVILVHAYFLVSKPIKKKALMEYLDGHHNIIRCSGIIVRLSNDLGTSSVRIYLFILRITVHIYIYIFFMLICVKFS